MTTGIGVLVLESRSDGTGTPGLMTSSRQRTEYGVTESYSRYMYVFPSRKFSILFDEGTLLCAERGKGRSVVGLRKG